MYYLNPIFVCFLFCFFVFVCIWIVDDNNDCQWVPQGNIMGILNELENKFTLIMGIFHTKRVVGRQVSTDMFGRVNNYWNFPL